MSDNPWDVDSIEVFSTLKCPECIFDSQEEDIFRLHAVENHPMSFVLFGKKIKDEEENENTENIRENKYENDENNYHDDYQDNGDNETDFTQEKDETVASVFVDCGETIKQEIKEETDGGYELDPLRESYAVTSLDQPVTYEEFFV